MGELQCLEPWVGGLWCCSLVVLYCLGLPISLGLEEAIGTGLDILEASVRISCVDSVKGYRPMKEEEVGGRLETSV